MKIIYKRLFIPHITANKIVIKYLTQQKHLVFVVRNIEISRILSLAIFA